MYWPAAPADHELATTRLKGLPELIASGKMHPLPYKLLEGGLEAVTVGLDMLKEKKVKGQKLVINLNSA